MKDSKVIQIPFFAFSMALKIHYFNITEYVLMIGIGFLNIFLI